MQPSKKKKKSGASHPTVCRVQIVKQGVCCAFDELYSHCHRKAEEFWHTIHLLENGTLKKELKRSELR